MVGLLVLPPSLVTTREAPLSDVGAAAGAAAGAGVGAAAAAVTLMTASPSNTGARRGGDRERDRLWLGGVEEVITALSVVSAGGVDW